jgi:hypothetical protein
MTDVTSEAVHGKVDGPDAAVLAAVDVRLIGQLVDRPRAGGLALVGEGGLLQQLTKRILESALEGEIMDHLGSNRPTRRRLRTPFSSGS